MEEITLAQFFFWNGIGAVGLGGYIWYDAHGDAVKRGRRVAGIMLTLGGVVCSLLAVTKVNAFVFGLSIPAILGPMLLLVGWAMIGYDIYLKKTMQRAKPMAYQSSVPTTHPLWKLTIHSALWGPGGGSYESVSDKIIERVKTIQIDRLDMAVIWQNLGDEQKDTHEHLKLDYSYGVERRQIEKKELEQLVIPELAGVPDAFTQNASRRADEIQKQLRNDKLEVKDELWGLILEYLRMLRAWPDAIPVREPFLVQWRPPIGETQYGQDVAAAMKWVTDLDRWTTKANNRLDGIVELDLTQKRNDRRAINQGALGALPFLLQALAHVYVQIQL